MKDTTAGLNPAASAPALQCLAPDGSVCGHFEWLPQPPSSGADLQQWLPGAWRPAPAHSAAPADADLLAVAHLRLYGGAGSTAAWLSHDNLERVCSLNGERLPAGQSMRVHSGDALEIGLLRLVLLLVAEDAPAAPADQGPAEDLDLTQLADAFGHDITADIVDAAALQVSAPGTTAGGLLPMGGFEPTWQTPGQTELQHLQQRYFEVLSDPSLLAQTDLGGLGTYVQGAGTAGRSGHPLDAQSFERKEKYINLFDMVAPGQSVDAIIRATDSLSDFDLLAAPLAEDVLHLFAPPEHHALHTKAHSPIASLTRREHHLAAADSALPLMALSASPSAPDAEPTTQTEHHHD